MYHNQGYAIWIQEVEEREREEVERKKTNDRWQNYDFEAWRRNRPTGKKKRHLYPPLDDDREHEERLADMCSKDRIPHRKRFGATWLPTRKRYWRPENNNWKRKRRTQYNPVML